MFIVLPATIVGHASPQQGLHAAERCLLAQSFKQKTLAEANATCIGRLDTRSAQLLGACGLGAPLNRCYASSKAGVGPLLHRRASLLAQSLSNERHLAWLLGELERNGARLHIVGDSIARQMAEAAPCDAARALGWAAAKVATAAAAEAERLASATVRLSVVMSRDAGAAALRQKTQALLRGVKAAAADARKRGSGIVLVCFGLHYSLQDEYVLALRATLSELQRLSAGCSRCVAALATPVTQHFATAGGAFGDADVRFVDARYVLQGYPCTALQQEVAPQLSASLRKDSQLQMAAAAASANVWRATLAVEAHAATTAAATTKAAVVGRQRRGGLNTSAAHGSSGGSIGSREARDGTSSGTRGVLLVRMDEATKHEWDGHFGAGTTVMLTGVPAATRGDVRGGHRQKSTIRQADCTHRCNGPDVWRLLWKDLIEAWSWTLRIRR